MLSKCKDSNAFTMAGGSRGSFVPVAIRFRFWVASRVLYCEMAVSKAVSGNSILSKVLDLSSTSVAPRRRATYLFDVERRLVLERARP